MRIERHVGRIPPTVLEDDLQATFAQFGLVETAKISGSGNRVGKVLATVAMVRAILLHRSMK